MNTHVDSHLLRLAEPAAAGVALERLLARVGPDVLAQVVPPPEALAAVRALEHRDRALRRHHRHSQRLRVPMTIHLSFHIIVFFYCVSVCYSHLILGGRSGSRFDDGRGGGHFGWRARHGHGLLAVGVRIGRRTTAPAERGARHRRRGGVSGHPGRRYRSGRRRGDRDERDGRLSGHPRSVRSDDRRRRHHDRRSSGRRRRQAHGKRWRHQSRALRRREPSQTKNRIKTFIHFNISIYFYLFPINDDKSML